MKTVPKPKNSAGRNVPIAIGVGVGLGALVIFAMWAGQLAWYILVAVAVAGAMWEVLTRLREHSYHLPRTLMIIGGQLMVWSSWPLETEGLIAFYVIAVLALMFGRLFHNGRHRPPINYLRDTAVGVFVLTWIPMFGSFAAMLSATSQGASSILVFMLCVVASDTGGYITGVMFGSHPMAPAVSPKKSWEGFAGSIIFGMVTGALSIHFLLEREAWAGVIMGLGLVVCATLGDLVESQFKRELGIKDMSNILPGHGGLMDRLDGMLPAAMVTWLAISFLGV
ncbi:phosphatidate cytidylyltransferase [Corynebacterium ammoniagenes]|uniref:Phosphatidate cytidylyltransferase n=2 Tax=Corynebacterium ammoniagenes TaxID=1697 RepID=A0AAV5G1X7_CORAM|nr:phosphatidate cytidylyltransferase [Corynebacterium ammoniagenes]AQS73493.1 phosphatidate cytidylyltransferase [Corynebacterium ammoniagenes]EFG82620.1 phosphatidate cytidylyltransferase [Corynebacterium ammoniagenes DSM 20306]NMF30982.1 phosphatidate cytidylyltransferase [Corynebacterium ammoniagenes]GJN42238.1 phosphatidate cytidylyltransferase [Corynebacterium ammoniagenes]